MSNKILMDAASVDRSITRLSHEILECNANADDIVLIGIHNRGVPLASRIQAKIQEFSGIDLKQGSLDITFHRDDKLSFHQYHKFLYKLLGFFHQFYFYSSNNCKKQYTSHFD